MQIMGTSEQPPCSLNFGAVVLQQFDLLELEAPFLEEEVHTIIMEMHAEKAPRPDGYTGLFFKRCWRIIMADLMRALYKLFCSNGQHFNRRNSAIITLLPKKEDPMSLKDYRPISLIHSISKNFTKLLVSRLAKWISEIVSPAHSAFIKKRCIHENFTFLQGLARTFHRQHKPMIMLKINIPKAFDIVS